MVMKVNVRMKEGNQTPEKIYIARKILMQMKIKYNINETRQMRKNECDIKRKSG